MKIINKAANFTLLICWIYMNSKVWFQTKGEITLTTVLWIYAGKNCKQDCTGPLRAHLGLPAQGPEILLIGKTLAP